MSDLFYSVMVRLSLINHIYFTWREHQNIKYEDSSVSNYGEHGSDFTEVEKYATGKNVDEFNIKGTKKREDTAFAEGRAEMEAEQAADEMDEFASGGLAKLLGE